MSVNVHHFVKKKYETRIVSKYEVLFDVSQQIALCNDAKGLHSTKIKTCVVVTTPHNKSSTDALPENIVCFNTLAEGYINITCMLLWCSSACLSVAISRNRQRQLTGYEL